MELELPWSSSQPCSSKRGSNVFVKPEKLDVGKERGKSLHFNRFKNSFFNQAGILLG